MRAFGNCLSLDLLCVPGGSYGVVRAIGDRETIEFVRWQAGAAKDGGQRTCRGPVKSSCVKSGKMTKPILKSDMSDLQSSTSERCMGVALLQYFGEIVS